MSDGIASFVAAIFIHNECHSEELYDEESALCLSLSMGERRRKADLSPPFKMTGMEK
jgi:hypothetical protein